MWSWCFPRRVSLTMLYVVVLKELQPIPSPVESSPMIWTRKQAEILEYARRLPLAYATTAAHRLMDSQKLLLGFLLNWVKLFLLYLKENLSHMIPLDLSYPVFIGHETARLHAVCSEVSVISPYTIFLSSSLTLIFVWLNLLSPWWNSDVKTSFLFPFLYACVLKYFRTWLFHAFANWIDPKCNTWIVTEQSEWYRFVSTIWFCWS